MTSQALTDNEQELLLGFVDGVLQPPDQARAEALLESNPGASAFVEQLRGGDMPFREALAPMLDQPIPETVSRLVADKQLKASPRRYGIASAMVAASMILGAALFLARPLTDTAPGIDAGWIGQVANYHQLYVRETVGAAGPVDRQAIASLLEQNLGRELATPDLQEFDIAFRRGQLLQVEGNPLVQLAYLPQTGAPVAFCIMRDSERAAMPVRYGKSHGLDYSTWGDGELHFVLVGEFNESTLQAVTTRIRSQLGTGRSRVNAVSG